MEETTKIVGGFRAALQDLLVPELKAMQTEMRGMREILDRHERWHEKHDQNFLDLIRETNERFAQVDNRFAQVDKRFAEVDRRFSEVLGLIRDVQASLESIHVKLDYGERMHKLEVKVARLAKAQEFRRPGSAA